MSELRYFSMFSGIGGFELGINKAFQRQAGVQPERQVDVLQPAGDSPDSDISLRDGRRTCPVCVGYSEIDKYAIQTYERHFDHANYGDATTISTADLPDFDLLVGGFPCQAFSVAGKRRGFDDTRGTLFFEVARILRDKRPKHLVLENVKGLLSHDSGKTFQTILGVLADLGYRVEWQVLNSKDFGVPQNRERVYIVGHLREGCGRQIFPIASANEASLAVGTLTARYAASTDTGAYLRNKDAAEARVRRLTPKECERLQGFPDDWTAGVSDTQRYKQCGNAVTVNVVEAVIGQMLDCLTDKHNKEQTS